MWMGRTQSKFLKEKCHACGKIGHLKRMCRSYRTQRTVKTVADTSFTDTGQYQLYHLEDSTLPKASKNPYMVMLTVDGKQLQFEVDTGESLSLISEVTYKEFWPNMPLQDTTVYLKTYTGTPLKVIGVMSASVSYCQQSVKLLLLVIEGTEATLMGRNWLEHIKLNWNNIHKVNSDHLQTVLMQYSDVFQPELGMMKDFKAKIFVDPTMHHAFVKHDQFHTL